MNVCTIYLLVFPCVLFRYLVLFLIVLSLTSVSPSLLFHSPSGWDSDKKIAILNDHMKTISPNAPYADVIKASPVQAQVCVCVCVCVSV